MKANYFFFESHAFNGIILLMKNDPESLNHLRHTLSHLLAAAVLELHPDAKPTIGPAIDNGFYYDFEFKSPVSDKDLPKIEKAMRKLLPTWKEFSHREVSEKEAKELFKGNKYKLELIDGIIADKQKITLYKCGEFEDLCRGGHIEHPARISPQTRSNSLVLPVPIGVEMKRMKCSRAFMA